MKVHYNTVLTGIKVGFGILIAKYFSRRTAAVAVRALYIYLYPLIYFKKFKAVNSDWP